MYLDIDILWSIVTIGSDAWAQQLENHCLDGGGDLLPSAQCTFIYSQIVPERSPI